MCILCGEIMSEEELREPEVICPDCKRPMHRKHVAEMKATGIEGCFYCESIKLTDKSDKERFEDLRDELKKRENPFGKHAGKKIKLPSPFQSLAISQAVPDKEVEINKLTQLYNSGIINRNEFMETIRDPEVSLRSDDVISSVTSARGWVSVRTDEAIMPGELLQPSDLSKGEVYPYRENDDIMSRKEGFSNGPFDGLALEELKLKTERTRVEIPPYRRTGRTTELVERAIDHVKRMKQLKYDVRVLFISDTQPMADVGKQYAIETLGGQKDASAILNAITFAGLQRAKAVGMGKRFTMCIADMNTDITPQHRDLINKIFRPVMQFYTTHVMWEGNIKRSFDVEMREEFREDRNWIIYESILSEKPDVDAIKARMEAHNKEVEELKHRARRVKIIRWVGFGFLSTVAIALLFMVG